MVDTIIYIIGSLIFAGILYYHIHYEDDSVEEDILDLGASIACGWFWPLAIIAVIVVIAVKFLGLFVKRVANVCALIDGFVHSMRER